MNKSRLEAFSDGVLAIIITIMVLDLKVPHNPTWKDYLDAYPVFASYALSYVFVGLYWSNHHNLFHAAGKINNKVLWLNMFALFWQSLIPFVTASMGENHFSNITVTMYALVMAACTIAHMFLVKALYKLHSADTVFSKSYRGQSKSYITIGVNMSAALIAFLGFPKTAFILMAIIALSWFIPNHKIINHQNGHTNFN